MPEYRIFTLTFGNKIAGPADGVSFVHQCDYYGRGLRRSTPSTASARSQLRRGGTRKANADDLLHRDKRRLGLPRVGYPYAVAATTVENLVAPACTAIQKSSFVSYDSLALRANYLTRCIVLGILLDQRTAKFAGQRSRLILAKLFCNGAAILGVKVEMGECAPGRIAHDERSRMFVDNPRRWKTAFGQSFVGDRLGHVSVQRHVSDRLLFFFDSGTEG